MWKVVKCVRNFVTGKPMQLAMREWRQVGRWRGLVGAVAIGALLGLMCPFGSQTTLATGVKYAFWMVNALAGFAAAVAAERLVSSALPSRSAAFRIVAIGLASAVPMTFFVAWTMGVIRPGRTFSPVQLLALFPYVALIQLLIARVAIPGGQAPAAGLAEEPATAPEYPRDLMARLPASLRRDILALEAEDHYVRVHTLHGSALILMRLADAAALIDPRLGLRVHRSWWVAKDAVRELETTAGRTIARLVDDREVPVSRSCLPAARSALAA